MGACAQPGRRHGVEIDHPPGAGDELPVDAESDERPQFRQLQSTTTTGTDHEVLGKIRIDDDPRPPAVVIRTVAECPRSGVQAPPARKWWDGVPINRRAWPRRREAK